MMEAGPKAHGLFHCEPVVKIEPPEDVKDIKTTHSDPDLDFFVNHSNSTSSSQTPSIWPYLLKTVRYKYQKEHGRNMDCVKMTKLLLQEVEILMDEVANFVRSCCTSHLDSNKLIANDSPTHILEVSERVSLGVLNDKVTRFQVNDIAVIPTAFKDSVFGPLEKKEMDLMEVEQSMIHSVFQDEDDDDDDLHVGLVEPIDLPLPEDFKMEPFPPMSTSGFPEPTLVPGKEGGKIKTFYKCEKCNKSFPKRKRYYNHKFNGKCTIEPKWIRWHKNHKRVECAHPDCTDKSHINYTYPGLMKHIIEMHTVQEDSTIQCPDCPLKFPLKAALKYHQEMAHQAHAKICTVCGKVVRDMRKHRLIHTGEKPFQCDRCSYRCARSSSLKRHLATHLNAAVLPQQSHLQQAPHGSSAQPSSVQHQQQQPHQPQQAPPPSLDEHKFSPHLALPQVILPQPPIPQQSQQQTLQMHPQDTQHTLLSMHPSQEHEPFDPSLQYRGMKFA